MKLTEEAKERQAQWIAGDPARVQCAEVAIYTMIGGGLLGRSAVSQPSSFYIDTRVGRLPYPKREILQAVQILSRVYGILDLPEPYVEDLGGLANLGVF